MAARESALRPEQNASPWDLSVRMLPSHCHVVTLQQAAVLSTDFYLTEATVPCCSWDLRHMRSVERERSHQGLAPTAAMCCRGSLEEMQRQK